MNAQDQITALQAFFSNEKEVSFVYLFGSYASGETTPTSDVDLAVFLTIEDAKLRFQKRCFLIGKLLHLLKKEVDLVVLNDLENNYLMHEILTKGKLIYQTDERQVFDFYTRKIHNTFDYLIHKQYVQSR